MKGMENLKNMSLKSKIFLAFFLASCIAGLIGGYAIKQMKNLETVYTESQERTTLPVAALGRISTLLQQEKQDLGTLLTRKNDTQIKELHVALQKTDKSIRTEISLLEKAALTKTELSQISELKKAYTTLSARKGQALELALKNNMPEAAKIIREIQTENSFEAMKNHVQLLMVSKAAQLGKVSSASSNIIDSAENSALIVVLLGMLLALSIGFIINRIVHKQLGDDPKLVAEIARSVATGNLSIEIDMEGKDSDSILGSMNEMIRAIKSLMGDTHMLAQAAMAGNLKARADESKHTGEFQRIITEVNGMLDATLEPVHHAAEQIGQLSRGEIFDEITDGYNGDFAELKESLNRMRNALEALRMDVREVCIASYEGYLDVRVDTDKHEGFFAKVAGGMNNIFENMTAPLKVTMDYTEKISKGELPEKISA